MSRHITDVIDEETDRDAQIITSPTKDTTNIEMEKDLEVPEGIVFESHESAYSFYQEYAKSMGFTTSIKNSRRSKKSKEFIDAKFACSRYGVTPESDSGTSRRPSVKKTDCKASMHVKRRKDSKWYIHEFIKEHNHELLPALAYHFRIHKNVKLAEKNNIDPMLFPPLAFALFLNLLISTSNAITDKQQLSKNVINDFLYLQNKARSALRVPPLVWDTKLAQYADSYASERQQDCLLKHSNGPYGENIFWGSGDGWSPAQAAAAWVAERRWYAHPSNSCNGGQDCGHYTQIVWKATKKIGCAKVTCFEGRGVFMTCNYDPPGNFIGEKPY